MVLPEICLGAIAGDCQRLNDSSGVIEWAPPGLAGFTVGDGSNTQGAVAEADGDEVGQDEGAVKHQVEQPVRDGLALSSTRLSRLFGSH